MRKYNGVHYDLDQKSQTLKLKSFYHEELLANPAGSRNGFKKFGGSSIGNIFETDAFKGQFLAFLHMARLTPPILQRKYVKAGEAVEPKVFALMQQKFPSLDIQHIEAAKVGYDYFKNTHQIVGGVPDGLIPSKKIVLEMKAVQAKKQAQWEQNNNMDVPLDYRKQAELYAYLLGYPIYAIVATYLQEEDYLDPQNIDLNQRNIAQYSYKVDVNKAKDDLNKIVEFWTYYARIGISPVYDARRDAKVVEYLNCHNEDEWREVFEKWKRLGEVDADITFEEVR
ncbi:MAGa7180 family putative nuclease [Mycoplasma simbae]|uniref:MAGa7180 family putative nuclease n=1 Tax=Mycoplasma simbae TaxID=36744 RepID=UPI000A01477B|nr:hypothetical protein [Mycoplasma simbae]